MWLLSILPETFIQIIIYGIFLTGILAYLASLFSNVLIMFLPYKAILNIVSVICIVVGVYLYGCNDTEVYWRAKVTEANVAIDKAKIELKAATTQVEVVQKQKQQAIDNQRVVIKDRILTITERIDSICKVDTSATQVLNDAAMYPKDTK